MNLAYMKKENSIILFNKKQVRRIWDAKNEFWYFSIIDVIEILTDSTLPKRYWSDLKSKLRSEGSEVYEKIVQLKFKAPDGKYYATDCFSTENLLRIIQSDLTDEWQERGMKKNLEYAILTKALLINRDI